MKPKNFENYQKVLLKGLLDLYNEKKLTSLGYYSETALATYFKRGKLVDGFFDRRVVRELVTPLVEKDKLVLRVLKAHPTDEKLNFIYSVDPNQIANIERFLKG